MKIVNSGIKLINVDLGHQGGEGGGLADEGAGVGEDLLHQAGAVGAEMDEQDLVELQPIRGGPGLQVGPAVVRRELVLGARLLGHLEEQQVGQLGDVLVVGDPVIFQDVTEVPELGDDVVGDVAHAVGRMASRKTSAESTRLVSGTTRGADGAGLKVRALRRDRFGVPRRRPGRCPGRSD